MEEVCHEALQFPKFSSFILAGKSGAGKTKFLLDFLARHRELGHEESYTHVYICYREAQDGLYEKMTHFFPSTTQIRFYQGEIPEDLYETMETGAAVHNLVIIDDLFSEAFSSETVKQLFISGRHKKCSIFLTTQNLFPPGTKHARTISLNANYLVLFKSRDLNQIKILSSQLLGEKNSSFLSEAFEDAIKRHGYLLIDCSCISDPTEFLRFRSGIFDPLPVIYLPKKKK